MSHKLRNTGKCIKISLLKCIEQLLTVDFCWKHDSLCAFVPQNIYHYEPE